MQLSRGGGQQLVGMRTVQLGEPSGSGGSKVQSPAAHGRVSNAAPRPSARIGGGLGPGLVRKAEGAAQ